MANEKISQLPVEAGTPDLNTLIEISAWSTGPVYASKSYTLSQLKALVYNGLANDLSGGLGGQVLYQSAVDTTEFLANGSAGQLLQSNGAALAPSWVNPPAAGITGSATVDYVPMMDTTTAIETSPISVKVGAVGINTIEDNAGLIIKEKSSASGLIILGVNRFDDTRIMSAQSDLVYTFENADGTVVNGGVDAYSQQGSDNIVANTNNFVIPQSSLVEITSTGSWDLTGIVPPGTGEQVIYLYKSNAGTITFKYNSSSSSSANRFLPFTGADFTLVMGQVIRLIYINARWRLF